MITYGISNIFDADVRNLIVQNDIVRGSSIALQSLMRDEEEVTGLAVSDLLEDCDARFRIALSVENLAFLVAG